MNPYSININQPGGGASTASALPGAFVAPLFNTGHFRPMLEMPVLFFDPVYETSPAKRFELYRKISDYMMFSGMTPYSQGNPNQPYLYEVAAGRLRREDYDPMMKLFGREGAVPARENHFFHGAEKALLGQVLGQPFEFVVQNVNTSFAERKIREDAEKGAKLGMEALFRQMMAGGDGATAPLSDPEIKLPKTQDDWLDYATSLEQIEGSMTKLLHHTGNVVNWKELERESVFHKTRVNCEFAQIRVENGAVLPEIIHPHQIRYMASRPVKTLEDSAVMGVQVTRYMTPTEFLNRTGQAKLGTGTGTAGVKAFFDELRKRSEQDIGYDPWATYITEQNYSNQWGPPGTYTSQQINWMNTFYPLAGRGMHLMMQQLVQDNYFMMQREKRYLVEKVDRTGHRNIATTRELERWQKEYVTVDYEIDFTPLPNREKANGRTVASYLRPEMWQFTRVGHASFIDEGPYKYQPDFLEDDREQPRMNWPVVGQMSREKSMYKLGENDAAQANVLYQRVSTLIGALGFEEAIIVDDIHEKNAVSYLYNAKQTGVIRIDSTKFAQGLDAQKLHLTTLKLGNNTEQILTLFKLIAELRQNFETRVGANEVVQGGGNPYQSAEAARQNVAGQALLNTEFNYEHSLFMNQLLQRCADVCKFHYAKDGEIVRVLTDGEAHVIRTTADMRLADFHIYLRSGAALAEKRKMLQVLVNGLLQSGGSEYADALLEIPLSDNPSEGMANYRRIKAQMDEAAQAQAQQAQQQAAQIAQQQADTEASKQRHELFMKRIDAELQIYLKQMDKNQADAQPPADLINQPGSDGSGPAGSAAPQPLQLPQ